MSHAVLPIDMPVLHEADITAGGAEPSAAILEYAPPESSVDSVALDDGTLKRRTIRSAMFTVGGYGSSQVIRFVRSPLLAYMLFPDAFGLTAIVGMFVGMFQQFSDVGLGPAIVQSDRGDEKRFLDTAWTLSIARGVLLFCCMSLVAWPVSVIYKQPILAKLLVVAGANAIFNGFNSTALLTLSRHLKLGRLTVLGLGGEIVTTVVSIALAWKTHSVWSIIAGGLACSVVQMVASHFLVPGYRNRFAWDKQATHELFHFGKWIFVSTALTYFANESDRLILGYCVPMALLGFYSQAAGLVRMPWEVISRLAGNSLFPALSRCADGPRDVFARKVRTARSVILPMGAAAVIGLVLGAPPLVSLLYDHRYLAIGWMAQFLAIGLWVTILQSSADRALLALGQARPLALTNLVNMTLTVACSIAGYAIGRGFHAADGTNFAIQGFILGVASGNVGGHLVVQAALKRNGISIYRQDLAYTLIMAVIAGVGLFVARRLVPMVHPHDARLLHVAWGGLVIGSVCLWSGLRVLKWMKQ